MKLLTTPIPQPRAGAASGAGAGAPSARGTTAANFGALLGKALGGTREPTGSGTADKGSAGQLETSAEQPDSSTGQAGSGSNSSPVPDVVVADFRVSVALASVPPELAKGAAGYAAADGTAVEGGTGEESAVGQDGDAPAVPSTADPDLAAPAAVAPAAVAHQQGTPAEPNAPSRQGTNAELGSAAAPGAQAQGKSALSAETAQQATGAAMPQGSSAGAPLRAGRPELAGLRTGQSATVPIDRLRFSALPSAGAHSMTDQPAAPQPAALQAAALQAAALQAASGQSGAGQEASLGTGAQTADSGAVATAANPAAVAQPVVPPLQQPVGTAAAPSTAPPAAAPVAPPLAEQLARPIFALAAAPLGEHVMTVNVVPDSLGPVTVRAHLSAEGVRIELMSLSDAGREGLRSILGDLRRDLAAGGMASTLSLGSGNANAAGPGSSASGAGGSGAGLGGGLGGGQAAQDNNSGHRNSHDSSNPFGSGARTNEQNPHPASRQSAPTSVNNSLDITV